MKTRTYKMAGLVLWALIGLQQADAATNVVLPGQSIQAQINISTAGDTVAIFGGTYSEDLVITQAVRLAEVSGQDVIINGSVLISGVTNAPPLDGFVIGSAGRGLTISNTPGILLMNLNIVGAGMSTWGITTAAVQNCQIASLSANGNSAKLMSVAIAGSVNQTRGDLELGSINVVGSITQSSGILYIVDSNIGGSINANNPSCTSMLFRCEITNDVNLGSLGVLAYSRARSYYSSTANATHEMVGNSFNLYEERVHAINIAGASNILLIANCNMKTVYWEGFLTYNSYYGINVESVSTRGYIINNYIQGNANVTVPDANTGIRCVGSGIKIINNIVITKGWGIRAPFGSSVFGNYVYNCPNRYADGVVPTEDFNLDPKYDISAQVLLTNSPCIDGGTTDARFRDRDGSRADAGPTGGAWYDPGGWTSTAPVLISFDLSTDQYLEGTLTNIVLSGGYAVSVP